MSQDANRAEDNEKKEPHQPTQSQTEQNNERSEAQFPSQIPSTPSEPIDRSENPYGIITPESKPTPVIDPYLAAQNPDTYNTPSQPEGRAEPVEPVNSGYAMPPQSGYGYADTPPQSGYTANNPYGREQYGQYNDIPPAAGFAFKGTGPGAPGQIALTPLPMKQALQQLFKQYIRIITHPSSRNFDGEIRKASWSIVWMQILILALGGGIITLLLSFIRLAIFGTTVKSSATLSSSSLMTVQIVTIITSSLLTIVIVPLSFFAGVGFIYLGAKAFKGQGTFLVQSYTTLLYEVPLRLISVLLTSLLLFIPVAGLYIGYAVAFAIGIYEIVLCVIQIRSSHRLSTGRAIGAVLIPYGILFAIGILCGVLLFVTILAASNIKL